MIKVPEYEQKWEGECKGRMTWVRPERGNKQIL